MLSPFSLNRDPISTWPMLLAVLLPGGLGQDERYVVTLEELGRAALHIGQAEFAAEDGVDLHVQPLLGEVPVVVGDVQPGRVGGRYRVHTIVDCSGGGPPAAPPP